MTREAVLVLLNDDRRYVPDGQLALILDRFRHDRAVHQALIGRTALSAGIVDRLVRLVASRRDLDALLIRHATGAAIAGDLRMARPLPRWWKIGLSAATPWA